MEARGQLTESQKEELKATFKLFKPDSEGLVSIVQVKELVTAIEDAKGGSVDRHSLIHLASEADPEQLRQKDIRTLTGISSLEFPTGYCDLTFEDFLETFQYSLDQPSETVLTQAFALLDLDQDGVVNPNDLMRIAKLVGVEVSCEAEAMELLHLVSEKSQLTFRDFEEYCKGELKR